MSTLPLHKPMDKENKHQPHALKKDKITTEDYHYCPKHIIFAEILQPELHSPEQITKTQEEDDRLYLRKRGMQAKPAKDLELKLFPC